MNLHSPEKFPSTIYFFVCISVVALLLFSCEDESTPESIPTRITISPDQATIDEGEEQAFNVTVYDQEDKIMPGVTVIWSTSHEQIATVNNQGVASGVAAGQSTITATVSGLSTNATLDVLPLIIPTRIEIEPASVTIQEGGEENLSATVFDQNDGEVETNSLVWSSSDEAVLTVDQNGLVTGIKEGEVTISVTLGEITASVSIKVEPVVPIVTTIIVNPENISVDRGEKVVFSATVLDQFDREMEGIEVEWESPFPCIASIDEEGSSYGYSTGSTPIIARAEGVEGNGTLEVAALPSGSPESMDGEWHMCYENTGQFIYIFYLEHDLNSEVFNNRYQRFTGTYYYVLIDSSRPIDLGEWYVSGNEFAYLSWQFILRGGLRGTFISEMKPVNEFQIKGTLVLPEGAPREIRMIKPLDLE
jgi:hypothetical protein